MHVERDGKENRFTVRYLAVYAKAGADWRMVAWQSTQPGLTARGLRRLAARWATDTLLRSRNERQDHGDSWRGFRRSIAAECELAAPAAARTSTRSRSSTSPRAFTSGPADAIMLGERTSRTDLARDGSTCSRRASDLSRRKPRASRCPIAQCSTGTASLKWDFLVIALGADLNPAAVPGLAEVAAHLLHGRWRAALEDQARSVFRGDVAIVIPKAPFKCPPCAVRGGSCAAARGIPAPWAGGKGRLAIHRLKARRWQRRVVEMGQYIKNELAQREIAFFPQRLLARSTAPLSASYSRAAA